MPYVNVPNDLSKIKTKIAFNLTRRQLICFGGAAAVGIPVYLLTRHALGGTGAMFLMIALMLPAFFMAMYVAEAIGGLEYSPCRGCVANTAHNDHTGSRLTGPFCLMTAQTIPARRLPNFVD